MESAVQFDTKPLLRPRQVEEAKSEIKSREDMLKSPHIEDKGEVMKQLRRMRKTFEEQVPHHPTSGEEEGRMVARSRELLAEIIPAMCSQEEMRKAPPGAVDKFMMGENSPAIKRKILEWKNLQLRLKPGEREAANLERYRPVTNTLNMDNAFIPGKQYHLPPVGAAMPVTFNEEQIAAIRALDPALADMLGSLGNAERALVKDTLTGGIGLADPARQAASEAGKRGATKKRTLSAEHKQKLLDGAAKKRAEKKAA